MTDRFWQDVPDAPFATLLRLIETYCHPEVYNEAIDDLKEAVELPGHSPVFDVFKDELCRALEHPGELPEGALRDAAQYSDRSDEDFLAQLWREIYPGEPLPTPGARIRCDAHHTCESIWLSPDWQEEYVSHEHRVTTFRSLDGLRLVGTLTENASPGAHAAVLVHGGGVTREEAGFFRRLAEGLAEAGVPSLRFDLRGHGESEGRQEDVTLAGIANDIRAAVEHVQAETGSGAVHLYGTSFSGGVCLMFAVRYAELVRSLTLANPLLDYKKRFIDDKPIWHDDHIDEAAGRELAEQGYVPHSPTFKLGRPLLNEVFYVAPSQMLGDVRAPTLFVHGTGDTFIPVESSRQAVGHLAGEAKLVEIEGAQHGFAVHEDPEYREPQTQEWQAFVIRVVAEWMAGHSR
ncbi:MAG TPA: alpha/beta fold hydrolase [Streptosporangiaceae bacterium]